MKQYDAIIIGVRQSRKDSCCRTFKPRLASCRRGTFKHDVWRNVSQHRLYPDENARARSRHCRLALHDDYPEQADLYKQAIGRKTD